MQFFGLYGTTFSSAALSAVAGLPPFLLYALFWPVPYVIVDRPHARGLRPLAACVRLAAAEPGAYAAAGLAAAALLFAAVLPWGALLPVLGPLAGLVTAHAYDRLAGSADAGAGEEPAG